MRSVALQEGIRALDLFERLPAGHTALEVIGSNFDPHLRHGELAVVDLGDRTPVHGELFAIRYETVFGEVTRIVQMSAYEVLDERLEPWTGWFARYRFARPGEITLSDGPMRAEAWSERRFVGRVVGYMAHSERSG